MKQTAGIEAIIVILITAETAPVAVGRMKSKTKPQILGRQEWLPAHFLRKSEDLLQISVRIWIV